MTDTPTSPTDPSDDDLLASLYLDGEATAEERALVEGRPELMARVREFEQVAAELSDVSPPPDLARVQISAALDLFDQQQATTSGSLDRVQPAAASTGEATVSSLASRRERKAARGIPTWLSAAAALALVVGGIGFVASRSGDSTDEATGAMDAAETISSSGADRATEATEESADGAAESMMQAEVAEDEAMEDDAMEEDAMASDAMEDEAMEDSDTEDRDAEADDAGDSEATEAEEAGDASPPAEPSPVPLADFDATVAADYLPFIDPALQLPISESPCAGSPLLDDLVEFDFFIPVVFEEQLASLLVQSADPTAAIIVGETCEIELE